MASETGTQLKKRPRVLDDFDDELAEFGKRPAPPAPIELPSGYRDEANPFNDAQLSAPFHWKLRAQKKAKAGESSALSAEEEAAQREATLVRSL